MEESCPFSQPFSSHSYPSGLWCKHDTLSPSTEVGGSEGREGGREGGREEVRGGSEGREGGREGGRERGRGKDYGEVKEIR